MRIACLATLCVVAFATIRCGSNGPTAQSASVGGPSNSPDAGPSPTGPAGGGDWLQYRYSPLGGTSENPGVFAASEAASVALLWSIPRDRFGVSGSYYYYSQPLIADDTVYFTTAFGGTAGGKVVAVSASDGSTRWGEFVPGRRDRRLGLLVPADAARFLGLPRDRRRHALRRRSGRQA